MAMLIGHSHQIFPDANSTVGQFNLPGVDKVKGTVKDSELKKVDGSGKATYGDLVEGSWKGSVDLGTKQATLDLHGALARPITQGEASIDGGQVDAKITNIDKASRRVVLSVKARELDEEKKAMADFGSSDSGASLGDILGAAIRRRNQSADAG